MEVYDLKFSKRTKKKVSACLSMILAVNTCSVISFIAAGSDSAEASTASSPAVSKAAAYLGTKVNPDKSIGDNRIINDTSYALSALRASGAKGYEDSFGWLSDKADSQNTDIILMEFQTRLVQYVFLEYSALFDSYFSCSPIKAVFMLFSVYCPLYTAFIAIVFSQICFHFNSSSIILLSCTNHLYKYC